MTSLAMVAQATIADGASGATWVVSAMFCGVAVSGVLSGRLASLGRPATIVAVGEAFRFAILIFAALCEAQQTYHLACLNLLLYAADGVIVPNRWQSIFGSVSGDRAKNDLIAKLQTVESISSMGAPLVAGLLFSWFGLSVSFYINSILVLPSLIFWSQAIWGRTSFAPNRTGVLLGYRLLFASTQLIQLNLARVVSGMAIPVWAIYIPSLLHNRFGPNFPIMQGLLAGAAVLSMLLCPRLIASMPRFKPLNGVERSQMIAKICLPVLYLGLIASHFEDIEFFGLALASCAFGAFLPSIKTCIISVGHRITEQEHFALIASAGDSLSRFAAAATSVLVGLLIGLSGSPAIQMSVVGILLSFASLAVFGIDRIGRLKVLSVAKQ